MAGSIDCRSLTIDFPLSIEAQSCALEGDAHDLKISSTYCDRRINSRRVAGADGADCEISDKQFWCV